MTKTEQESERKRRKLVDSLVKSLQNGTASEEKVEQTGPSEKERVTCEQRQSEQLARTPKSPLPIRNGTEPSVQITKSEVAESQGKRELHLGKKERNRSGSMGEKDGPCSERRQVPREKRGGASRENFPLKKKGESKSG